MRLFKEIDFIGYDCGWGSKDFRCEDGPDATNFSKIITHLEQNGFIANYAGALGLKDLGSHQELNTKDLTLPVLLTGLKKLINAIEYSLDNSNFPVIIGGDHSSAMGTWSALTHRTNSCEKFGLIWLDAHMDAHTPQTADQGKWGGHWHAMPVATLMGDGKKDLINLCVNSPKISNQHISLIGIRSYEPGEEEFLKHHNIAVYKMADIHKRGFQDIYQEAYNRATNGTNGFGLSIDIDGFDPLDAPGVGTPENDGLRARDVLPAIQNLASDPLFKALEIVEYNPHNGNDDITKTLIENIIYNVFGVKS